MSQSMYQPLNEIVLIATTLRVPVPSCEMFNYYVAYSKWAYLNNLLLIKIPRMRYETVDIARRLCAPTV